MSERYTSHSSGAGRLSKACSISFSTCSHGLSRQGPQGQAETLHADTKVARRVSIESELSTRPTAATLGSVRQKTKALPGRKLEAELWAQGHNIVAGRALTLVDSRAPCSKQTCACSAAHQRAKARRLQYCKFVWALKVFSSA